MLPSERLTGAADRRYQPGSKYNQQINSSRDSRTPPSGSLRAAPGGCYPPGSRNNQPLNTNNESRAPPSGSLRTAPGSCYPSGSRNHQPLATNETSKTLPSGSLRTAPGSCFPSGSRNNQPLATNETSRTLPSGSLRTAPGGGYPPGSRNSQPGTTNEEAAMPVSEFFRTAPGRFYPSNSKNIQPLNTNGESRIQPSGSLGTAPGSYPPGGSYYQLKSSSYKTSAPPFGTLRSSFGSCLPQHTTHRQPKYSHQQRNDSHWDNEAQPSKTLVIGDRRDVAGSGYPPAENQLTDYDQPRSVEELRGPTLADLVEEPTAFINKFLAEEPSCPQITHVLQQYRAYVLELASLANHSMSNERSWENMVGAQAKELARKKFQTLKADPQGLKSVLNAYRDAVDKLERILRRQSEPCNDVKSDGGLLNVSKIVSSGMDMLFGGESSMKDDSPEPLPESLPEPPQTFGWTNELPSSHQQSNVSLDSFAKLSRSLAAVSQSSSNSRVSNRSSQHPIELLPTDSRAQREVRRLAIENDDISSPTSDHPVDAPVVPPLDLSALSVSRVPANYSTPSLQDHGSVLSRGSTSPLVSPNENLSDIIRVYSEAANASVRSDSSVSPRGSPNVPSLSSTSPPLSPNFPSQISTSPRGSLNENLSGKVSFVRNYGKKTRSQPTSSNCSHHAITMASKTKSAPSSSAGAFMEGRELVFKPSSASAFSHQLERRLRDIHSHSSRDSYNSQEHPVIAAKEDSASVIPVRGSSLTSSSSHRSDQDGAQEAIPVHTTEREQGAIVYESESFAGSSDDRTDKQFPNSNNSRGKARQPGRACATPKSPRSNPCPPQHFLSDSSDSNEDCQPQEGSSLHDSHSGAHYETPTFMWQTQRSPISASLPSPPRMRTAATTKSPMSAHNDTRDMHQKFLKSGYVSPVADQKYRSPPSRYDYQQPDNMLKSPTAEVHHHTKGGQHSELLHREMKRKDDESQPSTFLGSRDSLAEKLREACDKLKEKASEAHTANEQLMQCEGLLGISRTSLAQCRQELEAIKTVKSIENRAVHSEVERLQKLLAQSVEKRRVAEDAVSSRKAELKTAQQTICTLSVDKDRLCDEMAQFAQDVEAEKIDYDTKLQEFKVMFEYCDQDRQSLKVHCEQLEKDLAAYMKKSQLKLDESCREKNQKEAQLKKLNQRNAELSEKVCRLEQEKVKVEYAKKRAVQDKEIADEKRRSMEQEKCKAEEARRKVEKESIQMERDKIRAEQENLQLQNGIKDIDAARKRLNEESLRLQEEIQQQHMKYVNIERENITLKTAKDQADSIKIISADDLKYVLDNISLSGTQMDAACPNCEMKSAELRRVAEQLEILFKAAGPMSRASTSSESSFMEKENRRLVEEMYATNDQILQLKHSFEQTLQELKFLQFENEALKEKAHSLQQDKENMKTILDQQPVATESLQRDNERLISELGFALHDLKNMKEKMEKRSSAADILKQENEESTRSEVNVTTDAYQARAMSLMDMNKELRNNLDQLQEDMHVLRNESNQQRDEFNGERERLAALLENFQNDVQSEKKENNRLKMKLAEARNEVEDIRQSMLLPDIPSNQAQSECNNCKMLQEKNDSLLSRFNRLRDEVENKKNSQSSLTQAAILCERCDVMKSENDNLNVELQNCKKELTKCLSTSEIINNSLKSLRAENERLAAELDDARCEMDVLKVQLKSEACSGADISRTSMLFGSTTAVSDQPIECPSGQQLSTSSHLLVPTVYSHHEIADYDQLLAREREMKAQVTELTQKLLDFNRKKRAEMDQFNRVLDECNNERKIIAEQQEKTVLEKNAEIERLRDEMSEIRDQSAMTEYKTCIEENSVLRQQTAKLQLEFDHLKKTAESGENNLHDITQMKLRIDQLESELKKVRSIEPTSEVARQPDESEDSDISKLQVELKIARKDIEMYHKGQSPSGSTAYIVRMRDQTIVQLHEKIANLKRFCQQCRDSGFTPRSNFSSPQGRSAHLDDKSEMLLIMTEDSTRLTEKIEKLENDNVKLIELIKQRDAKIFEMSDEIEWLIKGSAQQDLITTYTQRLKQGEEEMGQLHESMEALTKRHSSLMLAKENEMLEVRTNYAKQLLQLIAECTSRNSNQEVEMKKLCNELDNIEKRNIELEKALRDYEHMKTQQIPKLRADLDSLRKLRSDLRSEFDHCNQQLKEAMREIHVFEKDKIDRIKNYEVEMANKEEEIALIKSERDINETNTQAAIQQKDLENQRLRDELNNLAAVVEENGGAVTHWKIKLEDTNRQIADMEERHALLINAKNKEMNSLMSKIQELSAQIDSASSTNNSELFSLQSQLKELQRQHVDVLEQHDATLRLKEDEMKRLYSEIGDISARLHTLTKNKENEVNRLRKDLSSQTEEKEAILTGSQVTVQEKQAEIRKLRVDMEKMEVDAARLHANKNQEVTSMQNEYKQKMEQFMTDRAHLLAIKDNEIQNLKQEVEKHLNDAKDGGSSIAEMKKIIFQLEQDKTELLMLKDQWQSDMDKLYSEYEICLSDKVDFQNMVDRISREMEDRIEGLKQEHSEILKNKDAQIRDLYTKVEKIAKERGDMSAHLHKILQEKEQKIVELFQKLEEYDRCLNDAEQVFKTKLYKKTQEIKWLREEVRKMGEEGVRLLDMREEEIVKMRAHLKDMLRNMEHKYKNRTSSHVLITRPSQVTVTEPHLKPSKSSGKALRNNRTGKNSSHTMASSSRTKIKRR